MFKAQILHASIIKKGLHTDVYHCNLLLQAYTKTHAFSSAQKLLHFMPNANVVSHNTLLSGFFNAGLVPQALQAFSSAPTKDSHSWNILISGCVKNRRTQDAISHFMEMRQNSDLKPDDYAYLFALCLRFELWMYAGCGVIEGARKVFDEMPRRDFVTWNALISGYSRCGGLWAGVEPNSFTFGGLIAACETRNTVQRGKQLHGCAFKMFQSIPERDIVVGMELYVGMHNGEPAEALKLYNAMMRSWPSAISPNHATFVVCCSHGALHMYGGHAWKIMREAEALLLQMPFGADSVMWSTLLRACKLHRN
ncbi:pentatricopeptide repeat-containing protein [Senna tora]|uniref:Pentatricopeptide repeat-containing protein n=1 Tax=Senna tora TaxID=362788 RepID=A0A834WW36_9FABA|nr:pentatricopeptide repeat-containing protein [Senna tora]